MKTIILTILTALILTSLLVQELKAQDPIDLYEGIPLVIYPHRHTADMITTFPNSLNQIKEMGVYGVVAPDVIDWQYWLDQFEGYNLKVIPQYLWGDTTKWYIWKYSNSHYTIWEAEGTDPSKGSATLYYSDHTNYFNEGDTIVGRWAGGYDVPNGEELIYGPGYPQSVTYNFSDEIVEYTLEFFLKIKQRIPDLPPEYLNDVVCTLMVTNRRDGDTTAGEIDTIYSEEVKVSDFNGWNEWSNISFNYDLSEYIRTDQFYGSKGPDFLPRGSAYFVQFKIIWAGLNYLDLYIDKIGVHDDIGNQIVNNPNYQIRVANLVQSYINTPTIIGWYAVDEPGSIDNYEPYRVVDQIVDSVSNLPQNNYPIRLHSAITGSWRGTYAYGNYNYGMAHDVFVADEFWLRARPKNIQINTYIYHNPWDPGTISNWKEKNIELVTDAYYGRINKHDSSFAVSTQGGAYYFDEDGDCVIDDAWVIPSPVQTNYHVNLALLYGARELRIDPYFSSYYENCPELLNTYGLIDSNEVATANYNLYRFTIIPRLNGLFGKTLKRIHQTEQYPKITGGQRYNFIDNFSGNLECLPATANYDLGFFTDSETRDYFMIVSRWYNEEGVCPISANLDETYFDFINLSLTKFIEDTTYTVLNDDVSIKIDLTPGETELIRIVPVVKYGGTLIADEVAGDGMTLKGDMTIDNGATLTVNSTYNVYADIRVKAGGRIVTTGNGTIKFYQGHKLIVEGAAILAGTTSNKLKLDFVAPENSNGIIIKPGASLTISYCEIKNAVKGITSELNLYGLNIQNVNFVNCDSVAIYITGRNRLLEQLILTPPPPQIKYCNITNSDFGILVSNLSQIVIQGNHITNTDLGISLSNVSTPAVINNILTGTCQMPGIFLESCNGIVRGNSISGFSNGLTLGHSSPDIGGNTIEHNWNRGLYVGYGSLPNMRGKLVQDPIHPNLFYAVSGYNYINENGGRTIKDDGSEIFINDANAILGDIKIYGCNEIKDQRIPNTEDTPPLYNTQLLMNCRGSVQQIKIKAGGNFWNEHPIYRLEERFGDCIVYLDPILSAPCLLPDGSGGKLFITSSTGEIIDTLYAEEKTIGTLTETEQLYATAEEKFLTSDFEDAEIIYNQIISGNDSLAVKLDAYRRLFEIGKFLGRDEEYFTSLRDTYLSLAGTANDTLLIKIFNQLSSLSLVANQEYVPAINEFDEIIQQNPNTEEAVFAEVDALTTALMVGTGDSTLQKGTLGKYLIKSSGDYNSKLDEILRKHFGNSNKESEKEILPTEYTLYQNYPNPFNPVTTIKYDLPNTSDVTLVIYDILGRKVKELVNTKQQAGRYEIQFNASNLASGVYIYQLIAEKYMSSKKMIFLK